jgi:hypothetical protein
MKNIWTKEDKRKALGTITCCNPNCSPCTVIKKMLLTINLLQRKLKKVEKECEDTMQSEDDLQCSIASALGWNTYGFSFDECVRRIVAGDEKLRLKCKEGLNYLPSGRKKL